MVGTRAIGMVCSDPQRGHLALHELSGAVELPGQAEAIGVASLVDGAALLSRLPSLPERARLAESVGTLQGRCSVVQVRVRGELRPNGSDQTANLGPFRARNYAAALAGGPQDADVASASRERLLGDVPEFLRRFVAGRSEAEAVFLTILARLHARGLLDSTQSAPEHLAEACRSAIEHAGPGPRHIVLTNGADMVHVSAGTASGVIVMGGLSAEVAGRLDPSLTDSSMGRERLRRFRGVISVGALDAPLKANAVMPQGATLHVLPEVATVVIHRDLRLKIL